MSGCECKPDAKRKRDSAQPQATAQPSINCQILAELELKGMSGA